MAEASPEWRKPADVMKLRRRCSLGLEPRKIMSNSQVSSRLSLDNSGAERKPQKRKNPFAHSQVNITSDDCDGEKVWKAASSRDSDVTVNHSQQNQLDRLLDFDSRQAGVEPPTDAVQAPTWKTESPMDKTSDDDANVVSNKKLATERYSLDGSETFPLDWSLKTKVRFLSPTPFGWCTPLRGIDESRGVADFVQDCPLHTPEELVNAEDTSFKQQSFQRYTMYWIHPNVPWLQTFPRITRSLRPAGPASTLIQNDDVSKALYNDWCDSMNSVYMMVRHGICPYFYVCCYNLTILFRSAGVVRDEVHAVITPTTRGLRSALEAEGVEFTLPLHQTNSLDVRATQEIGNSARSEPTISATDDAEEDDENVDDDDSAASVWLQHLGLDQRRYRSVDPSKVRTQRDIFRQIDYRPESTVLVEGAAHTQALFNYVLNSSICFASTGPQAGLPPTILAPAAFRGATLQSLKVRQGSVTDQTPAFGAGRRRQMYTVELAGPVLPLAVAGLSRLFACTASGEFAASFAVHDPTLPLNCVRRQRGDAKNDDDRVTSDSKAVASSASPASCVTRMAKTEADVCHDAELGREGLRELVCRQGRYTWTSS